VFLIFFALCGVAAAALYLALNWRSPGGMIGASGAISGLMAAGIRMVGPAIFAANPPRLALAPILSPPVLVFSGLWVVVNLVPGFFGIGLTGEVQSIAWQAQLGGYFAGLFLSGLFDRWAPHADGDLQPAA